MPLNKENSPNRMDPTRVPLREDKRAAWQYLRQWQQVANMDKDLELMKIQTYSERAHTRLTTTVSNIYAIFLGFILTFYPLFFQNVLPLVGFGVATVVLTAGTIYEVFHTRNKYMKELQRISDMIETVKKGRELPVLKNLVAQ